jgi:hypothetical protein
MQKKQSNRRYLESGFTTASKVYEAGRLQNNGVTVGAGSLAGGQRQSFVFDGSTMITGFPSIISFAADSRTVSVWVYLQKTVRGGIAGTRDWNGNGWVLTPNYGTTGAVGYFHIGGTSAGFSAGLVQARWTHLCLTYSTVTKLATVYVNAAAVGTVVMSANPIDPNQGFTGAIGAEGIQVPLRYFVGRMSELTIYNRVLSNAEVAALYKEELR